MSRLHALANSLTKYVKVEHENENLEFSLKPYQGKNLVDVKQQLEDSGLRPATFAEIFALVNSVITKKCKFPGDKEEIHHHKKNLERIINLDDSYHCKKRKSNVLYGFTVLTKHTHMYNRTSLAHNLSREYLDLILQHTPEEILKLSETGFLDERTLGPFDNYYLVEHLLDKKIIKQLTTKHRKIYTGNNNSNSNKHRLPTIHSKHKSHIIEHGYSYSYSDDWGRDRTSHVSAKTFNSTSYFISTVLLNADLSQFYTFGIRH